MGTSKFNVEGNPAMDWHPIQEGVEILLWPDGSLESHADFTLPLLPTGKCKENIVYRQHFDDIIVLFHILPVYVSRQPNVVCFFKLRQLFKEVFLVASSSSYEKYTVIQGINRLTA